MGACLSSAGAPEQRDRTHSARIDKHLEDNTRNAKNEYKILLLGSGESGKSTIVKQMKIIHQNGYTPEELFVYRLTVIKNLIDSAQTIVLAMRQFKMEPEHLENRVEADANAALTPAMGKIIAALWKDPVISKLIQRSNEFYIMDNASYFFESAMRIARPDYVPSEQDVLNARSKTVGVLETRFRMGELSINLVDVGGQRSERNKWIHCFEAVTTILFCVALSEYDQALLEDSKQNRMAESLVLFESIINSRTSASHTDPRLKLPLRPLVDYFPEYTGGDDVGKAAKYILWRFTSVNHAKLNIYPHLTQATDTANIRLVFAAVKETLLQNSLRETGIL
ncbi:Gpa2p [Malassezia vespertilionis]|uniref:Guanine nucleotide-binding protein alpha-3 subunit n=1 Tax=Malassezia vespertilionis TaxID=2020962 RepID=A0A2N1JHC7_9BASI|nr:Gpa2p [Malassezia vespertilionis]